jgi:hypothetical protein
MPLSSLNERLFVNLCLKTIPLSIMLSAPQFTDVIYIRVARLSGDRDAESRIADRLLIPFRQFFRCSSLTEDEPPASDIGSTVAEAAVDVEWIKDDKKDDATNSIGNEALKQ